MQKQEENKALWGNYWAERQKSLRHPGGKRRAVTAAFELLKGLAGKSAKPVGIIELGCGEGHILGELLKMCEANKIPIKECVGVDNQPNAIQNARRLYPRASFLVADYANQPLNLKPFDLVMLVGTLHEVYSSNRSVASGEIDRDLGEKAVEKALRQSARLVGDKGYMVLFDGVEHSLPELKIVVNFQSTEAAEEFKQLASEYEAFHLEYEGLTPGDRVRISMHDFTRYITKTRFFNTNLWEIEKRESYQYFSANEFKKKLGGAGLKVLTLQCFSPRQKDWHRRVRIETPGVDFPKENILIVGQKTIPTGEAL
jgi:SAM-dependent methyltransferase